MADVERTFIAKGCEPRPNVLCWSSRINIIAFSSKSDVCLALPKSEDHGAEITNTACEHSGTIVCLKFAAFSKYLNYSGENVDFLVSACSNGGVVFWFVRRMERSCSILPLKKWKSGTNILNYCYAINYSCINGQLSSIIAYSSMRPMLYAQWIALDVDVIIRKRAEYSHGCRFGSESDEEECISIGQNFASSLAMIDFASNLTIMVASLTDSSICIFVGSHICKSFRPARKITGNFRRIASMDIKESPSVDGWSALLAVTGEFGLIHLWTFALIKADKDSEIVQFETAMHEIALQEFEIVGSDIWNRGNVKLVMRSESILRGHSADVNSVTWHPTELRLLSTSEDNSLIIWAPTDLPNSNEVDRGLWLEMARVGEVGGSEVGYWDGCFSADGRTVIGCISSGGLQAWELSNVYFYTVAEDSKRIVLNEVIIFGGHSQAVTDISWDPTGTYLLSCSHDRTTRCLSPYPSKGTFIEIARPQIHGYELNCIASVSPYFLAPEFSVFVVDCIAPNHYHRFNVLRFCFVSGGDEKLLRAFLAPLTFAQSMVNLSRCNFVKLFGNGEQLAGRGASLPALGLSNKEICDGDIPVADLAGKNECLVSNPMQLTQPPTDSHLKANTLWPEVHKLYGHGYEIYSVASNHCGTLIASACKASNCDHASIMLWDTREWKCRSELKIHQLTVVQLAFSPNDNFLLSISRDRTFSIIACSKHGSYDWTILPISIDIKKIHSRIIWCCSWSIDSKYFITGSRDQKLVLWSFENSIVQFVTDLKHKSAITAVDFCPEIFDGRYVFAVGYENGQIEIFEWSKSGCVLIKIKSMHNYDSHSSTVTRIRFRPCRGPWMSNVDCCGPCYELASASSDGAIKVYRVSFRISAAT